MHHHCRCFVSVAMLLGMLACSRQSPAPEPSPVTPQPGTLPVAASAPERPSSTRSVQCGAHTCIAGETRCVRREGKEPVCLPKNEADEHSRAGRDGDAIIACDDDSDCAVGEHCCSGQYWGGTGPHMHVCDSEPCAEAIACMVEGDCPKGLACRMGSSGYGHCDVAAPGTQCGSTRCGGATPVCCWNAEKQTGTCAPEAEYASCKQEGEEPIRCRGKADCGGYSCCVQMANGTGCWGTCPGPSLGVACLTMADCPAEGPGPGGMRQRYEACENGTCTGKLCNPQGEWVPCDSM